MATSRVELLLCGYLKVRLRVWVKMNVLKKWLVSKVVPLFPNQSYISLAYTVV